MQANDNTLAHYLYDNRISPPPEFSAQIDAFCGSLAQCKGHTSHPQRETRTGSKTRRARRWLMPLVAGLVVLAVVFSIPSVSRAVGDWIASIFRSEDYMAVKPDQREVNSDLADAVQTPMPHRRGKRPFGFSMRRSISTEQISGGRKTDMRRLTAGNTHG